MFSAWRIFKSSRPASAFDIRYYPGSTILRWLWYMILWENHFFLRKYWKIILKNGSFEYHSNHSNTNSFTNHTSNRGDNNLTKNYGSHKGKVNNEDFNEAYRSTSTVSLFGSGLQKTFATGNLSRICQIPVINPINKSNGSNFNDDSEPIYTDPSLFERSRWVPSECVKCSLSWFLSSIPQHLMSKRLNPSTQLFIFKYFVKTRKKIGLYNSDSVAIKIWVKEDEFVTFSLCNIFYNPLIYKMFYA